MRGEGIVEGIMVVEGVLLLLVLELEPHDQVNRRCQSGGKLEIV